MLYVIYAGLALGSGGGKHLRVLWIIHCFYMLGFQEPSPRKILACCFDTATDHLQGNLCMEATPTRTWGSLQYVPGWVQLSTVESLFVCFKTKGRVKAAFSPESHVFALPRTL